MSKRRILIQLDADPHASVFDRVVAIDAGVDEVFAYGNVSADDVEALVHGAIFTRGPKDLMNTAIFVGGRNVSRAEELVGAVERSFFGPLRCSVLMDASGCNTTAAATVLAASQHLDLAHAKALVLGGTGPVGQRVALLLAKLNAHVWIASRTRDRASDTCEAIQAKFEKAKVYPAALADSDSIAKHPERFNLVVAAGAAGTRLVGRDHLRAHTDLRVAIDLNAVPPSGIEGIEASDYGREVDSVIQYGALGIGKIKMKIHRASIMDLFSSNDKIMDAEEVFAIGQRLAE